jgi:hypothetical protein
MDGWQTALMQQLQNPFPINSCPEDTGAGDNAADPILDHRLECALKIRL